MTNSLWTYRKKRGLSQRQTAGLLGFKGSNNLCRYEHGARLPSLINALKLEVVYRTPVAFLFPELYRQLRKGIRQREENVQRKKDRNRNKRLT